MATSLPIPTARMLLPAGSYRTPSFNKDLERHCKLYKTGLEKLKLLERANQGYSRQLEKVLRLAYGRKGRRRKELLDALVPPEVPANTAAVMELIQKPRMYEDGWEPPAILMDLLKSQHNNGVISQLNHRQVKHLEPAIPKTNAWGRPVNMSRRKNIRQQCPRGASIREIAMEAAKEEDYLRRFFVTAQS
ncbi:hypothetical protein HFD88_003834 [Aspergillus terreus]|nr:hypothetical protein HFD88_003834 [Aspergillus terreus]